MKMDRLPPDALDNVRRKLLDLYWKEIDGRDRWNASAAAAPKNERDEDGELVRLRDRVFARMHHREAMIYRELVRLVGVSLGAAKKREKAKKT